MQTLQQFKNDMKWTMLEFNNDQLETIYNSINIEDYNTLEEIENDDIFEYAELFFDVSLFELIDYLNPLETTEAFNALVNNQYGFICDLYYLKDDNIFCMVTETR